MVAVVVFVVVRVMGPAHGGVVLWSGFPCPTCGITSSRIAGGSDPSFVFATAEASWSVLLFCPSVPCEEDDGCRASRSDTPDGKFDCSVVQYEFRCIDTRRKVGVATKNSSNAWQKPVSGGNGEI
ncbi:hypothetical protein DFJ73DRAFT_807640, partial [Zopfochytrium polystomum]